MTDSPHDQLHALAAHPVYGPHLRRAVAAVVPHAERDGYRKLNLVRIVQVSDDVRVEAADGHTLAIVTFYAPDCRGHGDAVLFEKAARSFGKANGPAPELQATPKDWPDINQHVPPLAHYSHEPVGRFGVSPVYMTRLGQTAQKLSGRHICGALKVQTPECGLGPIRMDGTFGGNAGTFSLTMVVMPMRLN